MKSGGAGPALIGQGITPGMEAAKDSLLVRERGWEWQKGERKGGGGEGGGGGREGGGGVKGRGGGGEEEGGGGCEGRGGRAKDERGLFIALYYVQCSLV